MSPFRPARPARPLWNVTTTILQLTFFWFVFLLFVPLVISIIEVQLAIQRFPPQPLLAAILLLLFSVLSLWSVVTMAVVGEGTPLPVDSARMLVVTGPYGYVRSPLVIATTGQLVAIGLALGSVPVLVYESAIQAGWYFFVRRAEERYLEQQFGKSWHDYRRRVRAFRPRLRPYRPR